jgi:carboxypeptidase C (cathepsin A)
LSRRSLRAGLKFAADADYILQRVEIIALVAGEREKNVTGLMTIRPATVGLVAFSLIALVGAASGQDARPQPSSPPATASPPSAAPSGQKAGPSSSRGSSAAGTSGETRRLPEDSTTRQTITVNGRTLAFTATAGSLRLFNGRGEPSADIAYTAYQLDGTDPRTRPVTFFFNGGPGASSAYLQLGCAGPWRLSIEGEGAVSSASPELKPNAETWLDFTDLVFIDPVDTGYSRFVSTDEDVRKRFFSVDGDVNALAVAIRRYLEKADRLLSPKFVVSESYGGIRGPKIIRELQTEQGVGVRGLILISPLLDFREFGGTSLLQYAISLPSMVAIARQAKQPVTRADMLTSRLTPVAIFSPT